MLVLNCVDVMFLKVEICASFNRVYNKPDDIKYIVMYKDFVCVSETFG